MEKVQVKNRLELKRQVITSLTQDNASNVKGGFTYSLSLGQVCKNSKALGIGNAFDCGIAMIRNSSM